MRCSISPTIFATTAYQTPPNPMQKLINHAAVRRRALEYSTRHRAGKFTRVSAAFLDDVEQSIDVLIYRLVASHPSMGKTLMGTKKESQPQNQGIPTPCAS